MNEEAASRYSGKLLFCLINSFQKYQFYGMMKEILSKGEVWGCKSLKREK